MNNRTILACSGGVLSRAVEGPDGQWSVEEKLGRVPVTCLTQDPSDDNVLYAGTDAAGVWRSPDGGGSWHLLGLESARVRSLAVSPHDGDTIFAGTKPAYMHQTNDGGKTWRELEGFRRIPNRWWWFSPAEPPEWAAYVMRITISPQNPAEILAGIEFGAVVRSEDGGESWSRHRRGALRDCHSLHFHPNDPSWVYEAGGGGLALSQDGGSTWQKQNKGLAKTYGIACASDASNPQMWYGCVGATPFNAFGEDPKVFLYRRQVDGWQPIGWQPHPLTETPTALVTIPDAPGHLYAGLQRGSVMVTQDSGDSWARLPFELPGIWHQMLVLYER